MLRPLTLALLLLLLGLVACQSTEEPPDDPGGGDPVKPLDKPTNLLSEPEREKLYFDLDRYSEQYIAERDRGNSITWTSLHASLLMPLVDDNLSELLKTLADPTEHHRRVIAAKALGFGSDAPRIAPALVETLESDDVYLVNNALVSLYYLGYGDTELQPLVDLLSHEDADIRSNDALALFAILRHRRVDGRVPMTEEVKKAAGNLLFLLADRSDPYVRGHAAGALGVIGDPALVDDLVNLLSDPSSFVRIKAAGGLGQIGEARAIPPLIQALTVSKGNESRMIVAAMTRIATQNGFPCDAEALGKDSASWTAWYGAVSRE